MGHAEPPHLCEEGEAWALTGLPGTVGEARAHARAFLEARRRRPSATAEDVMNAEDVLTVVSELVGNAVRHAPGPCTLRLVDHGATLVVEVGDTSTDVPRPRPPDLATGTGGFGWHLLHHLGTSLTVVPGPAGKTVRVVMPGSPTTGARQRTEPRIREAHIREPGIRSTDDGIPPA
ncbi:ATP-binding protein [Streptacidiphilus sp. PB12-B1b]|uniref:ATP-binding protein n=1 Tax=Streptacidiphilus sp. PB12-B1b TaxID=2705012 RepID=UPI0015F8F926|nr:ATP-binding protein [Streptacidiphilus sp. PB12-B1b]QMU76834.1 ATP-binding protein [Streptacidiphilus sp. PB12-B1b]